MKKPIAIALFTLSLGFLTAGAASAADKTYQVTGPVLEVTDNTVTIEKGKEKWQIARNKDTKVTGDLKVGGKATVQYTMTAATIEVKADGKAAKADKAADKGAEKGAADKAKEPAKK